MIGRRRVQIAPVGEAAFRELAGLADIARHAVLRRELHRHQDDPLAGRRPRRRRAHDLDNLRDRAEPPDRDPAARLQPLAVHVRVGIEEAGHRGTAAGVHDAGLPPASAQDLGVDADPDDAAFADRERLGLGPGGIEGENASVVEDEIGLGHRQVPPPLTRHCRYRASVEAQGASKRSRDMNGPADRLVAPTVRQSVGSPPGRNAIASAS